VDIENVLRGGQVVEVEWRESAKGIGSWRYRCETPRLTVIVAIRDEDEIVVVTSWRNG